MKFRVISGLYARRNLKAPDGDATHPMSERVRNAMFNIIGDEIQDAYVLDAFAGSGSVGIEALSRGAKHATFVERDRKASDALAENVDTLAIQNITKLIHSPIDAWMRSVTDTYDIIFVDPPYDDMQLSTVTAVMGLLKPNGLMVLSYPGRGEAPTGTNGVVVVDNRSYGTAGLTFYRLNG